MMIIQDLPQLERHYGRAGLYSFLGMSKVKVTFAQGDYQTADVISKYLGTYGAPTQSFSDRAGLPWTAGPRSRSTSQTPRALLLPQEILQLPPEEEIILMEGMPPIRVRKIRFFEESVFKDRLRPPVVVPPIEPLIRKLRLDPPPCRDLTGEEVNALREQYGLDETPEEEDGRTPVLP
jgi:type IV secretion system protein VirD4